MKTENLVYVQHERAVNEHGQAEFELRLGARDDTDRAAANG